MLLLAADFGAACERPVVLFPFELPAPLALALFERLEPELPALRVLELPELRALPELRVAVPRVLELPLPFVLFERLEAELPALRVLELPELDLPALDFPELFVDELPFDEVAVLLPDLLPVDADPLELFLLPAPFVEPVLELLPELLRLREAPEEDADDRLLPPPLLFEALLLFLWVTDSYASSTT